jgi:flagellar motor protein MotB
MSSKIVAVCLGIVVFASVGCSGIFVSKEQYDRDVNQQKEYIEALERDNAALKPKADAYDQLKGQVGISQESDRAFAELADALKKALAGMGVEPAEVFVGEKGQIVMAGDLLFERGSFNVSAKGKEVLKGIAQANRNSVLKIVGHTDRTRVAQVGTKNALPLMDNNLELSVMRADAVAWELIKNGVTERQISIEGKGASEPRAGGDAKCRRVEIFVVGSQAPAPAGPAKAVHKTSTK